MQNSKEVIGVTWARGVTTDHEVHSTKVFLAHTFGKDYTNNLRGVFALFLLEIFCKTFGCSYFSYFFDFYF